MSSFPKAMGAALVATVVLSILMVVKAFFGVMPELDLPHMLAGMMGMPEAIAAGWATHFFIGVVVYGVALAMLDTHLPGASHTLHGVLIAIGGWLVMMLALMPMAGAGLFAMNLGIMAPVMTLVLHLVFGAVLGASYASMLKHGPGAATLAH